MARRAVSPTASTAEPAIDLAAVGRRYWLVRRLSAPLHRGWLDVEREGLENVPDHGGVIFAANHLSFIDSVLLMYSGRRLSLIHISTWSTTPSPRRWRTTSTRSPTAPKRPNPGSPASTSAKAERTASPV